MIYIARRPSVVRPLSSFTISNIFIETAWSIKAKFYMEFPWVGGTKVCSRHLGHVTQMAATPIYGKHPFKNLLLLNLQVDFHETWYVTSGGFVYFVLIHGSRYQLIVYGIIDPLVLSFFYDVVFVILSRVYLIISPPIIDCNRCVHSTRRSFFLPYRRFLYCSFI